MSLAELDAKRAVGRAERFIMERGITELPVDPIEIAQHLKIEVIPKPASAEGVSGMLLRVGDAFAIAYATHIESEGFQRFSVAHELAHYLLPGHMDHVLPPGQATHESRGDFVSNDRYELEADHFAAALLMPNPLYSQAMKKAGEGLNAIEFMANLCRTSLTSTAIRYVQCTDTQVAMVMSANQEIDYCFMSGSFKEIGNLDWIHKSEPIPKGTATYQFNQSAEKVAQREKAYSTANIQDWFGGQRDLEMSEEVVGLGNYGKTLTILSLTDDPEEYDEEVDFEESLTPRFRR